MTSRDTIRVGICFACSVERLDDRDVLGWDTVARCDRAVALFRGGALDRLLCTGGLFSAGQTIPAAVLMKEYMESRNVPADLILVETESVDSVENIAFSLSLLQKNELAPSRVYFLVLVSETAHLQRLAVLLQSQLKHRGIPGVHVVLEGVDCVRSEAEAQQERLAYDLTVIDPLGEGEAFRMIRTARRPVDGRV